jgi:hypothetical protein
MNVAVSGIWARGAFTYLANTPLLDSEVLFGTSKRQPPATRTWLLNRLNRRAVEA